MALQGIEVGTCIQAPHGPCQRVSNDAGTGPIRRQARADTRAKAQPPSTKSTHNPDTVNEHRFPHASSDWAHPLCCRSSFLLVETMGATREQNLPICRADPCSPGSLGIPSKSRPFSPATPIDGTRTPKSARPLRPNKQAARSAEGGSGNCAHAHTAVTSGQPSATIPQSSYIVHQAELRRCCELGEVSHVGEHFMGAPGIAFFSRKTKTGEEFKSYWLRVN